MNTRELTLEQKKCLDELECDLNLKQVIRDTPEFNMYTAHSRVAKFRVTCCDVRPANLFYDEVSIQPTFPKRQQLLHPLQYESLYRE